MMDLSRRQAVGTALSAVALAFDPLKAHAQALVPLVLFDLANSMRVVSVTSFGATGDGISDDSAALNAAINYIRNAPTPAVHIHFGWRLDFPSGRYCVYEPLDLTRIQNVNTILSGNGSVIIGKCKGGPVIDAVSSQSITIRDLNIIGDSTQVPTIGIQIGATDQSGTSASYTLDNVKITGNFLLTCLYNRAAGKSSFYHIWAWNNNPKAYCIINDGMNHFNVKSEFAKTSISIDATINYSGNLFLNCDFRSLGGCPVWIGDAYNVSFVRCYAATTGDNSFVLFSGPSGNRLLSIDCHCETSSLKNVFLVDGLTSYVNIHGFEYIDHEPFATNSIFANSVNVKHTTIDSGIITIGVFANSKCKVFDNRDGWSFSGTYYSTESPGDSINNEINGRVIIGFDIFPGVSK